MDSLMGVMEHILDSLNDLYHLDPNSCNSMLHYIPLNI